MGDDSSPLWTGGVGCGSWAAGRASGYLFGLSAAVAFFGVSRAPTTLFPAGAVGDPFGRYGSELCNRGADLRDRTVRGHTSRPPCCDRAGDLCSHLHRMVCDRGV